MFLPSFLVGKSEMKEKEQHSERAGGDKKIAAYYGRQHGSLPISFLVTLCIVEAALAVKLVGYKNQNVAAASAAARLS